MANPNSIGLPKAKRALRSRSHKVELKELKVI